MKIKLFLLLLPILFILASCNEASKPLRIEKVGSRHLLLKKAVDVKPGEKLIVKSEKDKEATWSQTQVNKPDPGEDYYRVADSLKGAYSIPSIFSLDSYKEKIITAWQTKGSHIVYDKGLVYEYKFSKFWERGKSSYYNKVYFGKTNYLQAEKETKDLGTETAWNIIIFLFLAIALVMVPWICKDIFDDDNTTGGLIFVAFFFIGYFISMLSSITLIDDAFLLSIFGTLLVFMLSALALTILVGGMDIDSGYVLLIILSVVLIFSSLIFISGEVALMLAAISVTGYLSPVILRTFPFLEKILPAPPKK